MTNNYNLAGTGAELYEKILVPPLFGPWADALIGRAKLAAGEKVLDVGTGTGIVARKAAAIVGASGAVTGIDISQGMLSVARSARAPEQPKIEWVEGDVMKLPFADASFDAVFCQQGLQFFPDRGKAIKEISRVTKPGGRAALNVWRAAELNPYAIEFAKVVDKRVDPNAGAETLSPFAWDKPEEMSRLLKTAGFKTVQLEVVELDMPEPNLANFVINDLLAYPTTGKTIASWSTEKKDALVAEILDALESCREGDVWMIPWTCNIAIATK